jgi:hypothetical protein
VLNSVEKELEIDIKLQQVNLTDPIVLNSDVLMILGVDSSPLLKDGWNNLIEFISKGGLVFYDNAAFHGRKRMNLDEEEIIRQVAKNLSGKVEVKFINIDDPIFTTFHTLGVIPPGYEKINSNVDNILNIEGLYLNDRLAFIYSRKSYVMLWGDSDGKSQQQFVTNLIAYASMNKR